jgi:hypothetical protein
MNFKQFLEYREKHNKDYNHSKEGYVGGNPRYRDSKKPAYKKATPQNSRNAAKKVDEAFAHPSQFPGITPEGTLKFSMSVYKIVHNQADEEDWVRLDKYCAKIGKSTILTWIAQILKMNGEQEDQIHKEVEWFSKELAKGYN